MKTKTIKQTVVFNALPKAVYALLMDAGKYSEFSGSKVTIGKNVSDKFSVFDGYCHGYNIEVSENKKIVQGWHFAEDGWPDNHYSICTFIFQKNVNGTKLLFTQEGVPEHKYKALSSGWKEYYWQPMKEYLNIKAKK